MARGASAQYILQQLPTHLTEASNTEYSSF